MFGWVKARGAGMFVVGVAVAGCGAEDAGSAPPTIASSAPAPTKAPVVDGVLPSGADKQGWLDPGARCLDGERPVLLIGATRNSKEKFAVCERADATRVLRAAAPGLRAQPFEAPFFTYTANSQQFRNGDGMKIDLSKATVTVTDDPQNPRYIIGMVVEAYWSVIY
ncbi:hypothetical protein [Nocardia sp. NPDC050718]|uniref:hypothetical protein n=1 Tax=Nocardia sp. NPDC050718 TaxID=3155788 RepID=UPI0033E5773E